MVYTANYIASTKLRFIIKETRKNYGNYCKIMLRNLEEIIKNEIQS